MEIDDHNCEPKLTLRVDEDKIIFEIERMKPNTVLFNAPDGLLSKVSEIASKMEEKYHVDAFVSADPCYGSCDTTSFEIRNLGVDIAFHVGHALPIDRAVKKTVFVEAHDDVKFESVLVEALPVLKRYRTIGLCSFNEHLHEIPPSKKFLKEHGVDVFVGKGKGRLRDGQVLGCEFYTVSNIRNKVCAFVLLGQSRFHAIGVSLATGKPTYMLDPYLMQVVDIYSLAQERLKKAVLAVFKARDAHTFGVIVGLKEGQMLVQRALYFKKRLEENGKEVKLVALREISNERLSVLRGIDAYIQTACPRISIDAYNFCKPVLSPPQTEALLAILGGTEVGDFLKISSWL